MQTVALLTGVAVQMVLALKWRARTKQRRELAASSGHRELLANAVDQLSSPEMAVRLDAIRTMTALGREFPALHEEIQGRLRDHLVAKRSAYAGRALPSDLREISRALRLSGSGETTWPWQQFL